MPQKTEEEARSVNCIAHSVYCTALSADLGVFDDASAAELGPGYSVGPQVYEGCTSQLSFELPSVSVPL